MLRLRSRGGNNDFDWSFLAVAVGIGAGVGLAFLAVSLHSPAIGAGWAPVIAGEAFFVAGLALRLWAVVTLGRFFKVTVSIQDHHRVIRSGPYRVLRHPSYTGLLLLLGGLGLALGTWLGLAAIVVLPTRAPDSDPGRGGGAARGAGRGIRLLRGRDAAPDSRGLVAATATGV